jgi:hypothetical protein
MQRREARTIHYRLSPIRLAPYHARAGGDLIAALRLYAWNIEISAAFHGPLGVLEVGLRNAIDAELGRLVGRPDWWAPSAGLAFQARELERIAEARRAVAALARPAVPGDVVAELPFGFWTELLSRRYDMTLWRPALHRAFPNYHDSRQALHVGLYHLSKLRNRIAHHEPIHHRHLAADHR